MQNGLYVALSAQVALEQRLETIADNVANMSRKWQGLATLG